MKAKYPTELNEFEQSVCNAMLTNCNTNAEIAQRLGVTRRVVTYTLLGIYTKLGLTDKVALLHYLYKQQDLEKLR